ncbi:MAG: hypothetical protein V1875_01465 [Candidatus Altiarchaeota archaeon]
MHYTSNNDWGYLLRYYGVYDTWFAFNQPDLVIPIEKNWGKVKRPVQHIDCLIFFFKEVYREDEGVLISFLSKLLKSYNGHYPFHPFERSAIQQELNALGYTLDGLLDIRPTTGVGEIDKKVRSELDGLLIKLNPEFPNMRVGSWETLTSNHKDKERQAVTSMRELLDKVINQLVPDKGLKREDKIKKILSSSSESEAELIDSIAGVMDNLYHFHSKGTHDKLTFKQAMYALLISEYSLYYLLSQK